jgi:hypothetical protein
MVKDDIRAAEREYLTYREIRFLDAFREVMNKDNSGYWYLPDIPV